MKLSMIRLLGFFLFCGLPLIGQQSPPSPTPTPAAPAVDEAKLDGLLKNIPLYVLEYHILFATPFQGEPAHRSWRGWFPENPDQAIGPAWRRNLVSAAVPLIGPYSSEDPEVIRWQLRCAKAAGIDALEIQMYPSRDTGLGYTREELFAKIVAIAGEVQMPVFAHDEVMYVRGERSDKQVPGIFSYGSGTSFFQPTKAQMREFMTQRWETFLNRYGSLPGYYKVNGKPAISFQYWAPFMPIEDLTGMFHDVNAAVPGGVYIMPIGDSSEMRKIPEVGAVIPFANSADIKPYDNRNPDPGLATTNARLPDVIKAKEAGPVKPTGLWLYGGFDNAAYDGKGRWLSRGDELSHFKATFLRYAEAKPDFLQVSAWNEWRENSAIEPAMDVDGLGTDPYQALRLIARLKGKEFVPPPLPAFDHIDPWMSAPLGGPDKTPPYTTNVWVAPNNQEIRATFIDETSPIDHAMIARKAAASVGWNGAVLQSSGLTALKNPVVNQANDHSGAALEHPLFLQIDSPGDFKKSETAWLVVTYFDGASGQIQLNIPNTKIEHVEPTDLYKIPAYAPIGCAGSNQWKTVMRRLDEFAPSTDPGSNQIEFRPVRFAPGSAIKVLLNRVSLVRASEFDGKEIYNAGASAQKEAVTYRFRHVPWNPQSLESVLIQAVDVNGNACEPVVVTPGLLSTALMAPYPLF
jgi:hypothetical protein